MFDLELFMKEVHQVAVDKGWYSPAKSKVEALALVHCEVSEAIEEIRKGDLSPIYQLNSMYCVVEPDDDDWNRATKSEGLAVELADVVIRVLDFCEHYNIPLIDAMLLKNEYNKTRPFRHGKVL